MSYPIIVVYAEKGGVGKSTFAQALIEYLHQCNIPLSIFDFDRSNPNTYKVFRHDGAQLGFFSEATQHENAANAILEAALEKPVVVDTPAQCWAGMQTWFEKNTILELASEIGIPFHYFFLIDGEPDGLILLKHSLQYFGSAVRWTVVKNMGVAKDGGRPSAWKAYAEDAPLQQLLRDVEAGEITFPAFYGDQELMVIQKHRMKFTEAVQYPEFHLIAKQRVRNFIKAYSAVFDAMDLGLGANQKKLLESQAR